MCVCVRASVCVCVSVKSQGVAVAQCCWPAASAAPLSWWRLSAALQSLQATQPSVPPPSQQLDEMWHGPLPLGNRCPGGVSLGCGGCGYGNSDADSRVYGNGKIPSGWDGESMESVLGSLVVCGRQV